MNWQMVLFLGLFFLIYGLVNYYVGWRGWQAFSHMVSSYHWGWYWTLLVACLAASYPFGRWASDHVPHTLGKALIHIGSYWMAALYYLFLIFLLCDLVRIFNRAFDFLPPILRGKFPLLIVTVIVAVIILLVYGTWNAQRPVVRNYEIWVDRKASTIETLRIAAVSDVHLGWIVGIDRLRHMTETINRLEPDLVLLAGDIVDEGVDLTAEEEMPEVLGGLHPRWGTYAVLGNHEYISGQTDTAIAFLNQNGVTVLRDQAVEIRDAFYVVGRDDRSRHRFDGQSRMPLDDVMASVDKARLPIILMDHEPSDLQEAELAGVDLQFSGHTHLGQLFPNNYITKLIYEQDWGYLRKEHLQLIVSCGYGTWGPPIRIGNRPEIVSMSIHFVAPGEH